VPEGIGIVLVAFVAGAVPWSNLAARWTHGTDLRAVGSGTVSGTALFRVAGFGPLALAGVLDVAKGALGPLLAGDRPVLAAVAGGAAVVGHDWSPFLRGAGGRGIAPALGALLVTAWPGTVLLVGALVVGRALRRTGLACFVAEVALAPVLAVTSGRHGALAGGLVAAPMLLKRALGNPGPDRCPGRRAVLHRLLFDHEPGARR
jgi:glycerol-3-phosphate acyltransferase PlsY